MRSIGRIQSTESGTSSSLLQEARENSVDGWDRFVAEYSPLIYYWCRKWGLQPADAENIGQEVFIAAARHLSCFRRERKGAFRSWLRSICRTKFLDYVRKRHSFIDGRGGSEALSVLREIADPICCINEAVSHEQPDELSRAVQHVMQSVQCEFSHRDWFAFASVVLDEQSPRSVAAELNVSLNIIYLAKSRILHRLRTAMSEVAEFPLD